MQNLIVQNNQSGTLFEPWNLLHLGITKYTATLSPVVQKEDNTIHQTNHYLLDNAKFWFH